jgi:Uma2 family endonuclease
MPELAIQTTDGVKVAVVVWVSDFRADILLEEGVASIAPEICVEVRSASNTLEEMFTKKDLYLDANAQEVWFCDAKGKMSFDNQQGELSKPFLVPDFPAEMKRRNQPAS